jgi:nucleotide-binding universal stress UspA family protein
MYKHILIPTDGSRRSDGAALQAIKLAKALGARVTALHVVPQAEYPALEAWARHDPKFAQRLDTAFRNQAAIFLENVRDEALRAGVRCDCRIAKAPMPHAAIVKVAHESHCDLIVMASHGLLDHGLIDSETAKVAGLGDISVLVHH